MKNILCAFKEPGDCVLEQIHRFARDNGWQAQLCGGQVPRGWSGDGVLCDFFSLCELSAIRNLKSTPVVSRILQPKGNVRTVFPNTSKIAQMAAEDFLQKGFRHFAAVTAGPLHARYIHGVPRHILTAFRLALQAQGHTLELCDIAGEEVAFAARLRRLRRFLAAAPKPLALLLSNADPLALVYRAAHEQGLRVPEDVAVLCNTDNPLVTENAIVPTSYISGEFRELGNQMCSLLQRMMTGERVPQVPVYGTSSCIVTRRSTDTLAVTDSHLAAAVGFLLRAYAEPVRVEEAARVAGVSGTGLVRMFHKHLGVSPGRFLLTLRLKKARQLLSETSLTLDDIARQTGYGSGMALSLAFKRETGQLPGAYRRSRQGME